MAAETQLPPYQDSVSAVKFHPSNPDLLLAACWDSNVYLHDLTRVSSVKKAAIPGAVLDVAWYKEDAVFAGGLGNQVLLVNFNDETHKVITQHSEPIRCIEYIEQLDLVASASWDSTLKLASPTDPSRTLTLSLPGKVYAMSVSTTKLVVATSNRAFWIWDLDQIKSGIENGVAVEPWQKRESSLKFMTRAVKCMPNDQGYVMTSIEGRVAVEFFDDSTEGQSKKYAFKCHRQVIDGVDTVFPVNGLAFNPFYETFATGGADCTVTIWDPLAKKRIKNYPKYPGPVSSLSFSSDGQKLAIAWSENDDGGQQGCGNGCIIRVVGEEAKMKNK